MNISDLDGAGAYTPARIIPAIEAAAVRKAKLSWSALLILGVLAGAFLAFGGMLATLVTSGAGFSDPITRWIGGLAFSLGMILVTIAGAELFNWQ